MKRLFGIGILAPAFLLLGAANVQAQNTCPTGFLSGVIDDDVEVDGSSGGGTGSCAIGIPMAATIIGDLKVFAGGSAGVIFWVDRHGECST